MIIVGLEDCSTCETVKKLLPDVEYVQLKKGKVSSNLDTIIMSIKRSLGKLNPSGHFPVVLNDDFSKIIETDILLDNLSKSKLQHMLES